MGIVSEVLAGADSQGRFLNSSELEKFRKIGSEYSSRIDVVNDISKNASSIVSGAARALFSDQPQLISPGGNAYTSRRMSACLRDMEVILRYITYSILAGDPNILNDRCLNGLREVYLALGTPTSSVAASIQKMKEQTLEISTGKDLPENILNELSSYFDLAAVSIS